MRTVTKFTLFLRISFCRLTCRYLTENHPFLKLAPIKMEQRYIDPDVFVFYEVLSDEEIEFVKSMAKPRVSDSST